MSEEDFSELARRVTRMLPFVEHFKGDLKIAEAIEQACRVAYQQGFQAGCKSVKERPE